MAAPLRIALAQFDFPVGAVESNADRIAALIVQARDDFGAGLVLFPELALSGYPPEDLLLRPSFLSACEAALQRIAAQAQGIVAIVGWPQPAGSVVYNAASVLRDGRVEQTYRKRELPNYAVFDERRYFDVDPDGDTCVFAVGGVQVGLIICEDMWFPEPLAQTVAAGAQLVLVPNASPYERDKHAQRDALIAQRVHETRVDGRGVALAYLNLVGGQDALVFDGASVLADGDGIVHPAASAFLDQWLVADFDPESRRFSPVDWMVDGDESRDALAWRAVVRGTRDYCRKNAFETVWVGLSGGIDSSAVANLARRAARGPVPEPHRRCLKRCGRTSQRLVGHGRQGLWRRQREQDDVADPGDDPGVVVKRLVKIPEPEEQYRSGIKLLDIEILPKHRRRVFHGTQKNKV